MGINGFYKILEVDREASENELREAYERLVKIWDTDKHLTRKSEAEYKLERISMAYDVLSDPKKRKDYDSFGADAVPEWWSSSENGSETSYRSNSTDAENVFEDNVGECDGVGPGRLKKAPMAEYKLACSLDLEKLYKGAQKKMMLTQTIMDPVTGKYLTDIDSQACDYKACKNGKMCYLR